MKETVPVWETAETRLEAFVEYVQLTQDMNESVQTPIKR